MDCEEYSSSSTLAVHPPSMTNARKITEMSITISKRILKISEVPKYLYLSFSCFTCDIFRLDGCDSNPRLS